MMRRRNDLLTTALTAGLAIGLLAGPVTAVPDRSLDTAVEESTEGPTEGPTEEAFVPELRNERVYFSCEGTTGLAQVDGLTDGPSGWSTEKPSGTVGGGDGCTSVDVGHQGDAAGGTTFDLSFAGTYEGNLDELTVAVHALGLSGEVDVAVALSVDEEELVTWTRTVTVPVRGTHDPTMGVLELGVVGIDLLEEDDLREHQISLTLSLQGAPTAWVWGAADAPSGIEFHAETPAATRLVARSSDPAEPGDEPPLPALPAGPVIAAGPVAQSFGYLTTEVRMLQGMTPTFVNGDMVVHDVACRDRDANGERLCQSEMVGSGDAAPVSGAADLEPGTYAFYCSIHTGMTGTLEVLDL